MRVQPFSFIKEPVAEEGTPFPTLTGTLVDYWRADQGITLSGANVIEWEGQENGNVLEDATVGPTVSGSNAGFNNVDTLTFNGSTQGLGKIFSNLGGTDTGDVYMCMYGAPHGDGGGWGAIHGLSGLQSPFDFVEATMRGETISVISVWTNPNFSSNDDTYGKGLYTVAVGDNDPNGMTFFNKGTTINASRSPYSPYKTTRQGYTVGCYNFETGGSLHGKVDVAGIAIFVNPPNATGRNQDITAINAYFASIFG